MLPLDPASATALATSAVALIQPYLPALATKAAETLGEKVPDGIGKLWAGLKERFAKKPSAEEALQDLLKDPNNADVQAAFRVQLKKLLDEDKEFAASLKKLTEQAQPAQHFEAKVEGDQNVTVQGSGNTVNVNVPDAKKK